MAQVLHFHVQLFDLLLLRAAPAGFEHASVNNLHLLERVELPSDVLQQLASEEDQLARVSSVHRECGGEDVEPH